MKTWPSAMAGAERVGGSGTPALAAPVSPVHNGAHCFGVPAQLVTPPTSKISSFPAFEPLGSEVPTYASPFAMLTLETAAPSVARVHSGWQTFGAPEQPVTPPASNTAAPL